MQMRAHMDPDWTDGNKPKFHDIGMACNTSLAPGDIAGHRIFVANIPFRCSQDEVARLFQPFGSVLRVGCPLLQDLRLYRRSMNQALQEARSILRNGHSKRLTHVELNLFQNIDSKRYATANSSYRDTDRDIIAHAASLRPQWRNGQRALDPDGMSTRRGFAFVDFMDRTAAETAVRYGNGQLSLGGRTLRVQWGRPRTNQRRIHRIR